MSTASARPASAAGAAIELRGVVKDFSIGLRGVKLRAVDAVNLRIAPGQVYGLLGPNGSGKSTTIKLILGLLTPTAGECAIFGVPSTTVAARRDVGYLPEAPYFYRHLSGRELVRFFGRLCGLSGTTLAARVDESIALVGLDHGAADRRIGTYSKGMLQRIGLAQAIVHDPRLVILDEPTAGVDPMGTKVISDLILQLKSAGKTVLITSHLLGQIEEICDRVAILDRGRLVAEGAVSELAGGADGAAFATDGLSVAEKAELHAWFAARGRKVTEIAPPRVRLDRVFLDRVAKNDDA